MDQALDVSVGLPARFKWWPKISEIKESLDELHAPYVEAVRWERQARAQIAERPAAALPDMRSKKTYAQLAEDCAARGFPIGKVKYRGPDDQLAGSLRAKFGISQDDWDAIPNAKERA